VKLPRNLGAVGNFNHCLSVARGRYVCVLNDDDMMLPENLRRKTSALDAHPGVGFVCSHYHLMDQHGQRIPSHPNFRQPERRDTIERGHDFVRRSLLSGFALIMSSVVMRKDALETAGGFNEELCYTADYELWMRIALRYDVMLLATPLVQYRLHPSVSSRFTIVKDGCLIPNAAGQEDLFKAKLLIVTAARRQIENWDDLVRLVRRYAAGQLDYVVENLFLNEGRRFQGALYTVQMWGRYSRILAFARVFRTLVKACVGSRRSRKMSGLQARTQL
jgi:glycosyltransferase involved in cell wall biosynthesis